MWNVKQRPYVEFFLSEDKDLIMPLGFVLELSFWYKVGTSLHTQSIGGKAVSTVLMLKGTKRLLNETRLAKFRRVSAAVIFVEKANI